MDKNERYSAAPEKGAPVEPKKKEPIITPKDAYNFVKSQNVINKWFDKQGEPRFKAMAKAMREEFQKVKNFPLYQNVSEREAFDLFMGHLDLVGKYVFHGKKRNVIVACRSEKGNYNRTADIKRRLQIVVKRYPLISTFPAYPLRLYRSKGNSGNNIRHLAAAA